MRTISDVIKQTIRLEGGYNNDPDDEEVKYGINARTLAQWDERGVIKVCDVDEEMAYDIYYALYVCRPKIDRLPFAIQPVVFDAGVLYGQVTAVKMLQTALNKITIHTLSVDGLIGEKTALKAKQCLYSLNDKRVINAIVDERIIKAAEIVADNTKKVKFLAGWINRAEFFRV